MLINVKCLHLNIYEPDKFHEKQKSFFTAGAWLEAPKTSFLVTKLKYNSINSN